MEREQGAPADGATFWTARRIRLLPGLTGEERSAISQMRNYIAVKSGSGGAGGVGVKAKFANDYNAGRYQAVIADGEDLRKAGALDAQSMQIVAQAYYLSHNYNGCTNYLQTHFASGASEHAPQTTTATRANNRTASRLPCVDMAPSCFPFLASRIRPFILR